MQQFYTRLFCSCFRPFTACSRVPLYTIQHQLESLQNNFSCTSTKVVFFLWLRTVFGIVKKRRLTGNQRKKLRDRQAAALGLSPDELLRQRHSSMQEWKREQESLLSSRCPNCGIIGHSFKWCPFSSNFYLQNGIRARFRGPNGSWDGPAIQLTLEEKRRFRHFFGLLCMPLGLKSSETLPAAQIKVSE